MPTTVARRDPLHVRRLAAIASVQVIVSKSQIHTLLLTLTLILEGRTSSVSAVWHRCTQRFSQDARALLRAFGYDNEAALSSNATRIHSNLRASSVARTKHSSLSSNKANRTKHSSLSSNKANRSNQLQNDDASLADDEYVRRVLYPWDTQLHHHICGDVE